MGSKFFPSAQLPGPPHSILRRIEAVVETLLANGGDANAEDLQQLTKKPELQGHRIPVEVLKSHDMEDPS